MDLRPQQKTLAQLFVYATTFERMASGLAGHLQHFVTVFEAVPGIPVPLVKKAHRYLSAGKAYHIGCKEFLHLATECNENNYIERKEELNSIFRNFQYKMAQITGLLGELQSDFANANFPQVIVVPGKAANKPGGAPKRKGK